MDGSEKQTSKSSCTEMGWCRKVDDKHKASLLKGAVDFAERRRRWEVFKFATVLTVLKQGENLEIRISLETKRG